ncbi:HD domain-containing protein [Mrakia frigida]|uniref:HD domain-containing protein n=1 Tax=Mrakia frigida TaxID=29902 RepID=UPI003FCBFBA4
MNGTLTPPITADSATTSSYPAPGPTYKSTGNAAQDRLAFFHVLEKLKTQKRGGWVREGVPEPESIADHMYRMAVLALCVPNKDSAAPPLDVGKCVMMAVVHDLAEAHVGDITPVDGVSKKEKHRLEEVAMTSFLEEMLGGGEAAERIRELWNEYEAGQTPEAKFVKDLDRLELCLQTVEYERRHPNLHFPTFYTGSIPHIRHPAVQNWTSDLMDERKTLFEERGVAEAEKERKGLTGADGVVVKVGDKVVSE